MHWISFSINWETNVVIWIVAHFLMGHTLYFIFWGLLRFMSIIGTELKSSGGVGPEGISSILQGNYLRRCHYSYLRKSRVNFPRWEWKTSFYWLRRLRRIKSFNIFIRICPNVFFQFLGSHYFSINAFTLTVVKLWIRDSIYCNSAIHRMGLWVWILAISAL